MTKAELTRQLKNNYRRHEATITSPNGYSTRASIKKLTADGFLHLTVSFPDQPLGLTKYGNEVVFVYWHKNIANHSGLNTEGKKNYDWYLFQINHQIIYSCPEIKDTLSVSF